jgi:dCMP deaminase
LRLSVDDWAFKLMEVVALRSEDPSTQVGCVILDTMGRVVSTGYNGLPRKLSTDDFTLSERPIKYQHVVHADMNAILFAERHRLEGATMYLPFPPCSNCAKSIIQSGINCVKYNSEYVFKDADGGQDIGLSMMHMAGVRVIYYTPNPVAYSVNLSSTEKGINKHPDRGIRWRNTVRGAM